MKTEPERWPKLPAVALAGLPSIATPIQLPGCASALGVFTDNCIPSPAIFGLKAFPASSAAAAARAGLSRQARQLYDCPAATAV